MIIYNIFIINIHMSTSMAMTGRQGWADRLRSVSFFCWRRFAVLQLVALCFFSSTNCCILFFFFFKLLHYAFFYKLLNFVFSLVRRLVNIALRWDLKRLHCKVPPTHASCFCCCIWTLICYRCIWAFYVHLLASSYLKTEI